MRDATARRFLLACDALVSPTGAEPEEAVLMADLAELQSRLARAERLLPGRVAAGPYLAFLARTVHHRRQLLAASA
jgi:hypothetical protein